MVNPLISVIIVTLNADKTLQDCLNSVFQQTYKNLELIVIDGQSNDETVEILKENDEKISFWLTEKDDCVYDAMNKALNYANGNRVFFLGADDLLLPEFSQMIEFLKDDNTIYYGKSKFKKRIDGKKFRPFNLAKGNIIHQSIFYPKAVFDIYKYELKYPVLADYYLNIQCYNNEGFKFEFLPFVISVFASGGLSGKIKDKQFLADKDQIIKANFSKKIYYRYLLRKFKNKMGL